MILKQKKVDENPQEPIYDREYLSKLSDDDLNKIHKEMTERYIEDLPPDADKENYRNEVNKNLTGRESMISSIVTQYGEMNRGQNNGSDTSTQTFSMKDIDVRIADKTAFADNELKAMDEPTLGSIMMRLAELNALDMKQKGLPQDTEMYIEQVGKVRNKSQMISTIRQIQAELGFGAQPEININHLNDVGLKTADENGKIRTKEKYEFENIPNYLKVIDGKVGGKIPIADYYNIKKSSIKNPNADSIMFGKYANGSDSYIAKAGTDSSYFDMGNDWQIIRKKYKLSYKEMFDYFNKPVILDAVLKGKTIQFSHNPINDDGFLGMEWDFIKEICNKIDADLIKNGDIWYVK